MICAEERPTQTFHEFATGILKARQRLLCHLLSLSTLHGLLNWAVRSGLPGQPSACYEDFTKPSTADPRFGPSVASWLENPVFG
jgi:hypothetical protein